MERQSCSARQNAVSAESAPEVIASSVVNSTLITHEIKNELNMAPMDEPDTASPNPPKELTDLIGDGGRWQLHILILTTLAGVSIPWNHLGMSFLAFPVDHWCARPSGSHLTLEDWWWNHLPNVTIRGEQHHSQCEIFDSLDSLNRSTAKCHSYEFSAEFNSLVNEFDLVCGKEWLLSTSQSIYMLGFLASVLLSGQVSDLYGRRFALLANVVILSIAGLAAAFSPSFLVFTIWRFCIAFGNGGLGLVSYVLLMETLGKRRRVLYMFLQSFGWTIGYITYPLFAWLIRDWFYLQILITSPGFFMFSFYWLLPESPRWLIANGRLEEATRILKEAARVNGKNADDIAEQIQYLGGIHQEKGKVTVIDLLRHSNLRKKTLSLYFVWLVIAFVYYGVNLNTNELQGDIYINFFIMGLLEAPAPILCIFTLDRFGRKKPFILMLLVCGLSSFAIIFVPQRFATVSTSLAMIGKFCNNAAFSTVYIFSSEIFPTVARNIGVGSSSTVSRIGSSLAPFMKDLGNATNPSIPYALYGLLSLLAALCVLPIPETNDQLIPDTIDEAEKFGKTEKITTEIRLKEKQIFQEDNKPI